jgi:hypothetical protein
MHTHGDGIAMPPPYHHSRLWVGNPTLDTILNVWYGACTPSGPPSWKDFRALIFHPWMVHLVLAESRHRMKPARCETAFPLAALMLGLPAFGFSGVFPMDNPRTAVLSKLTVQVCKGRRMIFKPLPDTIRRDGTLSQVWVIGLPMAPIPTGSNFPPYKLEQALFAVVHAKDESGLLYCRNLV